MKAGKIYFAVVFWGDKFRQLFADFCLASLVAPNNVPFLSSPQAGGVEGKLLVCSTPKEFSDLQRDPRFKILARHISVELVDIGLPDEKGARASKQLHMSSGHRICVERCLADKAYGSFLAPDMILSDGSVRTLVKYIQERKPIILAPAFRFDLEKCTRHLLANGYLMPQQPMVVPPRKLSAIAVDSIHSELVRFEFDKPHFEESPISTLFWRENGDLLAHTSSWAVAAADFSRLQSFRDHHFENNTIDAHFIDDHFFGDPNLGDPILLTDSDDYLMVSLTSEADLPIAPMIRNDRYFEGRTPEQVNQIKISYIRSFLFSHWSDKFKRWAYRVPVHIHAHQLVRGQDAAVERTREIINQAGAVGTLPAPIYFCIAFWGDKFRQLFLKYLLPSMLSPNNAPVLAGIRGCRLLVATTRDDWDRIIQDHLFHRLTYYIDVELIDISYPEPGDLPQLHMSKGHKAATLRCVEDKAFGSYLAPDLVLSDGTVARMVDLANQGFNAVLVMAPRYNMDIVEKNLAASGNLMPHRPIFITPRDMTRLTVDALHSEFLRFNWDAPHFCDWPIAMYREAPGGFAMHSASWAILLGNFGKVKKPAINTLDTNTIDQFFIDQNFYEFYETGQMAFVTDSDDINFMSMTSEKDLTFLPLTRNRHHQAPQWVSEQIKLADLSRYLSGGESDRLKRALYQMPALFHSSDITPDWSVVLDGLRRYVSLALENGTINAATALGWLDQHGYRTLPTSPTSPGLPAIVPTARRRLSFGYLLAVFEFVQRDPKQASKKIFDRLRKIATGR